VTPIAVDTHSLLWYLEGNPALAPAASAALDHPDAQWFVSVIVVAEALRLIHKGKRRVTVAQLDEALAIEPAAVLQPLTLAIVRDVPMG